MIYTMKYMYIENYKYTIIKVWNPICKKIDGTASDYEN